MRDFPRCKMEMHDLIHSKDGRMGPTASLSTAAEKHFLQLTENEPADLATVQTQPSLSPIHARLHFMKVSLHVPLSLENFTVPQPLMEQKYCLTMLQQPPTLTILSR
jgi:hypothetical protein